MVKKEENIKKQNKNFNNKKQKKANKTQGNTTEKKPAPVPLKESVKDHFFTFNLKIDLFTILYSTIVFKWIQTDRVIIFVDDNKLGYHIELFLKYFRMNSVFLDNEMPVNTNKHYNNQFHKGVYNICICSTTFKENSPQFSKELLDESPIPATIIYFDVVDTDLLQYHCFNPNTKAIYHFITKENKTKFTENYESIDERIEFQEFKYDEDQVSHLRYRCEDLYHSIHKSDIKKAKIKKINQELLYSKNMQEFFKQNPEEKSKIIQSIEKSSIGKGIKPSATYLPNYIVHQKNSSENNEFAQAIQRNYSNKKPKFNGSNERRKKGTMEKYLESIERDDGTSANFKF